MKMIASNFKTNHTRKSTEEYCKTLESHCKSLSNFSHKITLFPPSSALLDNDFSMFQIGAQNAYPVQNGSFTGEIGLEQLEEFHIKTILVGHSERREILGESQEECVRKFKFFAQNDFTIFYCIGENLEIKKSGLDATLKFLESQLCGIYLNYHRLIIAYEPIWAIGTGVSASLEEIAKIHNALKQKLGKIPLLYGGSVKAENSAGILSLEGVDGVLVGSASWDFKNFSKILENS